MIDILLVEPSPNWLMNILPNENITNEAYCQDQENCEVNPWMVWQLSLFPAKFLFLQMIV